VRADLNSAENRVVNVRKYFNFLLNKPLDREIEVSYTFADAPALDTATNLASREELKMIETARDINALSIRQGRLARLPKVNAFLDLGSQAQNWKYNDQSRYYLVGVQLSLPLFQGFRNNISIRQSTLELRKTELSQTRTTEQLQLAVDVARNDLQTTVQNYSAAREQLKSAQSYFNLVEKGYQEGVNTLIEFLDARNQLTASQLQQNLRLFEMLTAEARLERETASYTF